MKTEAKYTKLYKDWLTTSTNPSSPLSQPYGTVLRTYMTSKYTNVDGGKLADMLEDVFNFYEIGTDDEEMLQFIKDTFDEYGAYYGEVIGNYEKEYNYALNNKRVTTKIDDLTIAGSSKVDSEDKRSSTDYELPNKVIDEEKFRSTPSRINDNEGNGKQEKSYDNNTNRTSTHTVEFNNEFIDLKNKYMRQIRNVYHEFAMKFKECFYQVY